MDAFESIVGGILEREGYWVRYNFKVALTTEEKRRIGLPTVPRWDLDIVAYKAGRDDLLVVECKSYLDSPGVSFRAFSGSGHKDSKRYKLFNNARLRKTVLHRLCMQLKENGTCHPSPCITLCLAAGHVSSNQDRISLSKHFKKHRWRLLDDQSIRKELTNVAKTPFQSDVAIMVAKLLLPKPTMTRGEIRE